MACVLVRIVHSFHRHLCTLAATRPRAPRRESQVDKSPRVYRVSSSDGKNGRAGLVQGATTPIDGRGAELYTSAPFVRAQHGV